jgi:hypothetical protein
LLFEVDVVSTAVLDLFVLALVLQQLSQLGLPTLELLGLGEGSGGGVEVGVPVDGVAVLLVGLGEAELGSH